MMQLAALLASAYAVFVFVAETFSPFSKPKMHTRRSQWKYGRRVAAAVLAGGLCSFVLGQLSPETYYTNILVGAIVALLVILFVSLGRIKHVLMR